MDAHPNLPALPRLRHHTQLSVSLPAPGVQVVRVGGDLDALGAPAFLSFARPRLSRGTHLVVDVTRLGFCGVAGLAALAELGALARRRGADYTVVAERAMARHAAAAGLGALVPVAWSLARALRRDTRLPCPPWPSGA